MLLYSSQISHLCRLFFWQYSFSHHLRFMTTGEDRNKDRFKTWKFCGLWKLPFRHHGAVKFTQNCVCYTTPCINPFVPTSVTHEYYPKVLEHLHLLHCISAHLLNTLPWVFWETQYLNLFSADFRSCLVQRSRKPIKCVLKTLMWRSTDAAPIRLQKANGSPYSSQQWHPLRRICDCLSNSHRPWLSKCFGRGPHKLLHNSSRAGHLAYCYFFGIYFILLNQHIFRKYMIFSLLAKCVLRPGEMASQVGFVGRAVVWRTLI